MRRPLLRLLLTALLLVTAAGCYTTTPAPSARQAPAYARQAPHHRHFTDTDALAAFLRYGSDAGPLLSAHRGGPAPGFPENALASFARSLRYAPALLEVDVRPTADGALVLMHDATLDRTTTGTGLVAEHTLATLRTLLLKDPRGIITPYRIPTLDEALAWADHRAVLQLDVKPGVRPEALLAAVRRAGAANRVMVIAYTPNDALTYHRLAPDLMISIPATSMAELDALLIDGVDVSRFVGFTGVGTVQPALIARLHDHGIRAIMATFGTLDDRAAAAGPEVYLPLLHQGVDILATDDVALAARALEAARTPAP